MFYGTTDVWNAKFVKGISGRGVRYEGTMYKYIFVKQDYWVFVVACGQDRGEF